MAHEYEGNMVNEFDQYLQIAAAINKDISEILKKAMSGDGKYRNNGGFVRWVLVEKDIHSTVNKNLTEDES